MRIELSLDQAPSYCTVQSLMLPMLHKFPVPYYREVV